MLFTSTTVTASTDATPTPTPTSPGASVPTIVWPERDLYGKVRTMTSKGLRSKKHADGYVTRIERLTGVSVEG